MSSVDYGPVPISRLKGESAALFEALASGRRVLVSRHGRVVAAIEPASVTRHATQLANFAAASTSPEVRELTPTGLGQGSPSEFVRQAEAGTPSLVTKNGKVYGVLTTPQGGEDLAMVDEREQALKKFEQDHPDASPDEIANFVADWSWIKRLRSDTDDLGVKVILSYVNDPQSDIRLLAEALLVRGITQERTRAFDDAVETFETVIRKFKNETDDLVRRRVNLSMLELAKVYADADRPNDALSLTQEIEDRVQVGDSIGFAATHATSAARTASAAG